MSKKFAEYKNLNLSDINKEVLKHWKDNDTFNKSLEQQEGKPSFVFYEGPPSANGKPGIHHVMARGIKDIFCRYKSLQGFQVKRKAGWDTHGLPVELGVEKSLGITKEDIGKNITVEEYNNHCRKDVMKYTDLWEDLTDKMGYWLDMDDPYITYESKYIETLWHLLKELYNKEMLYKGYTIQPYSPAAGTGLSSHELNLPGCYKDVKDTTVVGQFKVVKDDKSAFLFENTDTEEVHFLAWTTTPWTLPSNTALAVGEKIKYVKVRSFNQYTGKAITVILARERFDAYFSSKNAALNIEDYKEGDKKVPFKVLDEFTGKDIEGIRYEQLIDWVKPEGDAFRVIVGDFITTEDGTGIVHIAPTFGADDFRVAKQNNISPLIVRKGDGTKINPLVDKTGKFVPVSEMNAEFAQKYVNNESYKNFEGKYVKNDYDANATNETEPTDIQIAVDLKLNNKAFKVEKYEHNYPHCWRTDKPVLYYPLDSWFIKTTQVKDRMIELNKTINWKPESTGSGRFGKWLENLVDWNLSRSRYWGTPLPIWTNKNKTEFKCIGSFEELKNECQKSVEAGFMDSNPLSEFVPGDYSKENYDKVNPHKPIVDDIILVSDNGEQMFREPDLIDVWFDSGAMPYAQLHYPFENKETFKNNFPADFIAEGVDQTRGWFFTLHALSTMLFDSVAFKNIISNGLVLDKNGQKMSKRLGNGVDPFEAIEKHGTDSLRWYMITNSQPWDNLKFDEEGVNEVKRKFFGTLYNTYNFFALYANVDGFSGSEEEVPFNERPEIDRWILSVLNTLVKDVKNAYENYEPTLAGRAIQNFVMENLSNWYVRLNRKRYWGGKYNQDKISAYQTLYTCLKTVSVLASPIAPFYMDKIYGDLTGNLQDSVHTTTFPEIFEEQINKQLENEMGMAQKISSMVLGLRRKVNIKVRQPLQKIRIPVLNEEMKRNIDAVKGIILSETNIKEIELISGQDEMLVKQIKPNFKVLGPRFGKNMKLVAGAINKMSQEDINALEVAGEFKVEVAGNDEMIKLSEVEIVTQDIPGWLVAHEGNITIALDVNITTELRNEGIAREFINRIQNLRKDSGFEVTDKIILKIQKHDEINEALTVHNQYVSEQTLANELNLVEKLEQNESNHVEIDNISTLISLNKA